jgi:MFS family permease
MAPAMSSATLRACPSSTPVQERRWQNTVSCAPWPWPERPFSALTNRLQLLQLHRTRHVVLALGTAQTLVWASSYYLPAMLAAPMSRSLGVQPSTVYAALSMALLIGAAISPWAGRQVDRKGGRPVLLLSNAFFIVGLVALAAAQGLPSMLVAWALLGLGMGCGLYDTAFAALVHLYGKGARQPISGITLLAGFASTVGWPLSALMEAQWGWRGACLGWAGLLLLVAVPLNAVLPRRPMQTAAAAAAVVLPATADEAPTPQLADGAAASAAPPRRGLMALMALIFCCMGFVSASISTHLPAILQAGGLGLAAAVSLAALAGPSQVAGHLLELGVLHRYTPLLTARVAAAGHPLGALLLLLAGTPLALAFVLVHGLGNGIITIVRGALPLAVFGAQGYGARQGWLNLPSRVVGALSPWFFGLLLQRFGAAALWVTAAAGLASLVLLQLLPRLHGRRPHG